MFCTIAVDVGVMMRVGSTRGAWFVGGMNGVDVERGEQAEERKMMMRRIRFRRGMKRSISYLKTKRTRRGESVSIQ